MYRVGRQQIRTGPRTGNAWCLAHLMAARTTCGPSPPTVAIRRCSLRAGTVRLLRRPRLVPRRDEVLYSRMSDAATATRRHSRAVAVADQTVEVMLAAAPGEFFSGHDGPRGLAVARRRKDQQEAGLGHRRRDSVPDRHFRAGDRASIRSPIRPCSPRPPTGPGTANSSCTAPCRRPTLPLPDLFTISPDGSGITRLTTLSDDGGAAAEPAWSVDGSPGLFRHDYAGRAARQARPWCLGQAGTPSPRSAANIRRDDTPGFTRRPEHCPWNINNGTAPKCRSDSPLQGRNRRSRSGGGAAYFGEEVPVTCALLVMGPSWVVRRRTLTCMPLSKSRLPQT